MERKRDPDLLRVDDVVPSKLILHNDEMIDWEDLKENIFPLYIQMK